jgi:hypothetical protein
MPEGFVAVTGRWAWTVDSLSTSAIETDPMLSQDTDGAPPSVRSGTWEGGSGDWGDPANWAGGVPNGFGADAFIVSAGSYTVSIGSSEGFTVGGLTLDAAGATLAIAGQLDLDGTMTLTAGDISLGDPDQVGPGTLIFGGAASTATLTLGPSLDLVGVGGVLDSEDATATLVNQGSITGFVTIENGIFTNAGTINGSVDAQVANFENAAGGVITIGQYSGTTIETSASFTNAGAITVGDHGTLTLQPDGTWSDTGTITVADGGTLVIDPNGSWAAPGGITLTAGAQLQLGGIFTTATLDELAVKGIALTIYGNGTLLNTDATLRVGTGSVLGTVVLKGSIEGGRIIDGGGGFDVNYGTLDDVTYEGPLDLGSGGADIVSLGIDNAFRLTGSRGVGPGSIELNALSASLGFGGTQTLNNVTITLEKYRSWSYIYVGSTNPSELTLGKGVNIVTSSAKYENFEIANGDGAPVRVVNDGSITLNSAGALFNLGDSFMPDTSVIPSFLYQ